MQSQVLICHKCHDRFKDSVILHKHKIQCEGMKSSPQFMHGGCRHEKKILETSHSCSWCKGEFNNEMGFENHLETTTLCEPTDYVLNQSYII